MTDAKKRTIERYKPLGEKLEGRLVSYAAAAGAAGVGLLAFAQPAGAQVIYTPAHVIIGPGSTYDLDVNHDGKTDFLFTDFKATSFNFASLVVAPFASNDGEEGNAVEVKGPEIFSPLALDRGAAIGPGKSFYGSCVGCNSSQEGMAASNDGGDSGSWVNVEGRYLGLKLLINHEPHYGWARFTVRVKGFSITALLTGYAYEATANKPILAGQTPGDGASANVTPKSSAKTEAFLGAPGAQELTKQGLEPASLGLLALGSLGLGFWRRKKSPAALRER